MQIIPHSRSALQAASFAHHKMMQTGYYPCILPVIWIRNRHFLILDKVQRPDVCVLRSPLSLGF